MTRRLAAALFIVCPAWFAEESIAGAYKGKWNGMSAEGDFILRLEQSAGAWKATIQFTIAGVEVPTTVAMLEVAGAKLDVKYDFDLAGNKLQSHLIGEFKDGQFSGKYKTRAPGAEATVDEGTCAARRQQ